KRETGENEGKRKGCILLQWLDLISNSRRGKRKNNRGLTFTCSVRALTSISNWRSRARAAYPPENQWTRHSGEKMKQERERWPLLAKELFLDDWGSERTKSNP